MYGRGFKQTAIISMSMSVFSVVVGILISYVFDITPAGTIVLLSIGLLAGTMGIKSAGLLAKN
jgi:zinc transport system permease protein